MSSYRIPLLGGNTKGRDHLEFPAVNTNPDSSHFFQDITPANAARWLWRVRKWSFNGDLSCTVHGTYRVADAFSDEYTSTVDTTITNLPIEQPDGNALATPAVDERGLVKVVRNVTSPAILNLGTFQLSGDPSPYITTTSSISGLGTPTNPGTWSLDSIGFTLELGLQTFWRNVYWDNPNIMPDLTMFFSIRPTWLNHLAIRTPQDIRFGSGTSISITPGLSGFIDSGSAFDMDSGAASPEIDYLPPSDTTSTFVNPSGTSVSVSGFSLTPIEFWPFVNSLGQSCYDTSTGAQINDPFA